MTITYAGLFVLTAMTVWCVIILIKVIYKRKKKQCNRKILDCIRDHYEVRYR